jgi:hypothetical protein
MNFLNNWRGRNSTNNIILPRKGIAILIILSLLGITFPMRIDANPNRNVATEGTEYWALLIGVGVYAGHPYEDRPDMLQEVEELHDTLLVSSYWEDDHIKVIKGENCTVFNMIKGLRWLDAMDDNDDISIVYITTHGLGLGLDIPPFDEEDGSDEALVSYRGFQLKMALIWDDLLNLLLSLLDSKGVCVIIDSCYAGGFNDPPFFSNLVYKNNMRSVEWMKEFAEDIQGQGRVVLMSCREDELSYSWVFTPILIEALRGYADINQDGTCSAEETFTYIEDNMHFGDMHPTLYDGYPGELQLTEVEFPPTVPETPYGQIIGTTNTTYNYSTVSVDPEGDRIRYGWDWNSDNVVDEWTDFFDSGTNITISHSWSVEGTYNIKCMAQDERGVESLWSNQTVVSMCSEHVPDQRQTEMDGGIFLTRWVAQSFIPTVSPLSKVELAIESWSSGNPKPILLYIRENLTGENLAKISVIVPPNGYEKAVWATFDFEDLNVIPGNIYYIVCESVSHWGYCWRGIEPGLYAAGSFYTSNDGGLSWMMYPDGDGCFVTWTKS